MAFSIYFMVIGIIHPMTIKHKIVNSTWPIDEQQVLLNQ